MGDCNFTYKNGERFLRKGKEIGTGTTQANSTVRSKVISQLKEQDIIENSIIFDKTSPFKSEYFVSQLKEAIGRAYNFDYDTELTVSELNEAVQELKTYVETERDTFSNILKNAREQGKDFNDAVEEYRRKRNK